jgi:hypothetical protein
MGSPIPFANIEQNQNYDDDLVKQLARVIEVLPDLED